MAKIQRLFTDGARRKGISSKENRFSAMVQETVQYLLSEGFLCELCLFLYPLSLELLLLMVQFLSY